MMASDLDAARLASLRLNGARAAPAGQRVGSGGDCLLRC